MPTVVTFDKSEVEKFVLTFPDFLALPPEEKCIAFAYFVQEIKCDPAIDDKDLTACHNFLDLPILNLARIFNLMIEQQILLDHGSGVYRLSAIVVDKIRKEFIFSFLNMDADQNYAAPSNNQNEELSKFLILHSKITAVSKQLFLNGHFPQAIFESVKVLEQEIKSKSGINNKIGVDLVNHVFSETNPILKVIEGDNIEHVDEREGFRYLLVGVFRGIKNPHSHSIQELSDPTKALEYLAMISIVKACH